MLQLQQQSHFPGVQEEREEDQVNTGREMGHYSMFPKARPTPTLYTNSMNQVPQYSDPFAGIKQFMTSAAPESQKQQYMQNLITPRVSGLIPP